MDSDIINHWLETQLTALGDGSVGFVSSHLYEIDSRLAHDDGDFAFGRELLTHTTDQIARKGLDLVVRLRIELSFSTELDTTLPNLETIRGPRGLNEPQPAIYLIRPTLLGEPVRRESYRCSYLETPWGDGYVVEYECFRPLEDWWPGEEFGRDLWAQVPVA